MSIGATAVKPTVEAKAAVERFLKDMAAAATKTFPAWQKKLIEGFDECILPYDVQHALIDAHPLDDYYYAGVIALEAAKIRRLFAPDEASELISLIGELVDATADRKDRLVSDMVFFVMQRVENAASVDTQKMPHDEVVKALLQKLGVDRNKETVHLMREILFRHELGEPLALGVPQWWQLFRTKYSLAGKHDEMWVSSPAAPPAPPTRAPRRATAII